MTRSIKGPEWYDKQIDICVESETLARNIGETELADDFRNQAARWSEMKSKFCNDEREVL